MNAVHRGVNYCVCVDTKILLFPFKNEFPFPFLSLNKKLVKLSLVKVFGYITIFAKYYFCREGLIKPSWNSLHSIKEKVPKKKLSCVFDIL